MKQAYKRPFDLTVLAHLLLLPLWLLLWTLIPLLIWLEERLKPKIKMENGTTQ